MARRIEVFDSIPKLAHAAAAHLAACVERATLERGWCNVALPGGPFVRPIYTELAQFQLRWSDVTFYFTDERCIPISHPASNYGEAIDKFLKNPRIDLFQFRRIEAELPDRDLTAEEYARMLPDEFDVLLAELGPDGHIAGLYPNSPAVRERERLAMPVQAPTRPVQRITLTPPALASAREVLIVATGRDRAESVQRALAPEGNEHASPARIFGDATWFVDREAHEIT